MDRGAVLDWVAGAASGCAVTGCAKRNADRELARVLALLDVRISRASTVASEHEAAGRREYSDWMASHVSALCDFREDLVALEHREQKGAPLSVDNQRAADAIERATRKAVQSGIERVNGAVWDAILGWKPKDGTP